MKYINPWQVNPFAGLAGPLINYPLEHTGNKAEMGSQLLLPGVGGPQGNPLGSVRPRPGPNGTPDCQPMTFGPVMTWNNLGEANWMAQVIAGVGTRAYPNPINGNIDYLFKMPTSQTSF